MSKIRLESSDKETFEINVNVIKCSGTINDMLENLDNDEDTIPLPNVNAATLRRVLRWAEYHKDDPVSVKDDENEEKRADNISSWDANFCRIDQAALFNLILAANYLDIKGLMDLTCKTVANMIKGKEPEEIRADFRLTDSEIAANQQQATNE